MASEDTVGKHGSLLAVESQQHHGMCSDDDSRSRYAHLVLHGRDFQAIARKAECSVRRLRTGLEEKCRSPSLDGFNSLQNRGQGCAAAAPSEARMNAQPSPAILSPEPTAILSLPAQLPLMQSSWGAAGSPHAPHGRGNNKSAAQLAQERLLSGAAFAREFRISHGFRRHLRR